MCFCDPLADREADARAADGARTLRVSLVKALEDPLQLFRRNSSSLSSTTISAPESRCSSEMKTSSPAEVLDRVVDEIKY